MQLTLRGEEEVLLGRMGKNVEKTLTLFFVSLPLQIPIKFIILELKNS
jgi:hypothetical protein